jgi:hypothetical protein
MKIREKKKLCEELTIMPTSTSTKLLYVCEIVTINFRFVTMFVIVGVFHT